MSRQDRPKRVAVTGYGALCSMGETSAEIWDSLLDYQVGYGVWEHPDPAVQARFFGFMEPNRARYSRFPKTITRFLPEFAKFALVVAAEAIEMAFGPGGSQDDHYHPFESAIVFGTGWGGLDSHNLNLTDYAASGLAASYSTLLAMPSVAAAALSMNWNFRGFQSTPVAACATGAMAIGEACEVIKAGRAAFALAGAAESMKDRFNVWSIDVLQALSKEQQDVRRACCPFSLHRSGFVLSEGAAVLCLEDFDRAVQRGARILGEVTGYGNYSDACDMTAPAADLQSRVHAIQDCLARAGRRPEEVGYVNTHGTSTPINDVNENEAIKAALGGPAHDIPMSSTKSYTGHLVAAAGAMEAIFCLKAIETGTIPATVHLDEPDPQCDLDYVPNRHLQGRGIDAALNLSFGFGGTNAALLLERAA